MKIHTKVIIDMATDKVISDEYYEYSGDIAQCGGGSKGDSIDKAYNARMATIYEQQQEMADYYFKHWQGLPQEYENAQVQANLDLMPQQIGLEQRGLNYQSEQLDQANEWYKKFKPVQERYMREATGGIDIGKRRSEAVAGVEQQFSQAMPQYSRSLSRRGLQAGASDLRQMAISKAVAKAGASTAAKNYGEAEQFQRLGQASMTQYSRPKLGG